MQYMEKGSLYDYLTKDFKFLNWKNKIYILCHIIDGLKNIHEQNIIHHDLHSGNILQSHNRGNHSTCIADLGSSISANETSTPNRSYIFGVLPYLAPEVFHDRYRSEW